MNEETNNKDNNNKKSLSLLLLDDEQDILNALKRLLRKDFSIVTFTKGQDALNYLAEHPIDLIMSDMRMPEMDGAEFLTKSRSIHPGAMRLLLTGYSDMDSTIKAINDGGVYSYIGKPWANEELKLTLLTASEHYLLEKKTQSLTAQLTQANAELAGLNQSLEKKVEQRTAELTAGKKKIQDTLKIQKELSFDVIDMLSATIGYRTGFSIGHIKRIAVQSREVAVKLGLEPMVCRRVYLCALLHEIGCVGLTDDLLSKLALPHTVQGQEAENYPIIGAEIVGCVKRFSTLVNSIKHQNENVDGSGYPGQLIGDTIPIGSRIIRVVKDFDFLIAGKANTKKRSAEQAKDWIKEKAWTWYDNDVIEAFLHVVDQRGIDKTHLEYSVGVDALKVGDTLLDALVLKNGKTMLNAGLQINSTIIAKLNEYEKNHHTKVNLFII